MSIAAEIVPVFQGHVLDAPPHLKKLRPNLLQCSKATSFTPTSLPPSGTLAFLAARMDSHASTCDYKNSKRDYKNRTCDYKNSTNTTNCSSEHLGCCVTSGAGPYHSRHAQAKAGAPCVPAIALADKGIQGGLHHPHGLVARRFTV